MCCDSTNSDRGTIDLHRTPQLSGRDAFRGQPQVIAQSGYQLLTDPALNKGTAFTERERQYFGLDGLLPPHVSTLEEQVDRRLMALRDLPTDLERYILLRDLQDVNEILFYALIVANLEEMLPIVYTPTVGLGCQQFSRLFRRPRGLFLSVPLKDRLRQILARPRLDNVEMIVVTDGERVLGLGDQGVGGMGIATGKTALYTCCAGLHPPTTLPIMLDVGTDNEELLDDPLYLGWRHKRVRGHEYDDFIEAFVSAVSDRWPQAVVQWEDFAKSNATCLLDRYRDRLCTFNDDIQGTAAAATGMLLAALQATGTSLADQRICIFGAGSAGCGIANLLLRALTEAGLSERHARERLLLVDIDGLLVETMPNLLPFQRPFAQPEAAITGWTVHSNRRIGVLETITNGCPTVLIGVSGQPGAFDEHIIREMAARVQRPVILPLSNPVSRSEAVPSDLLAWTEERAIVGVGSPFPAVERNGESVRFDQTNNSYIFPGVGLGVVASGARRVSDGMFMAAAKALASLSPAKNSSGANLLPPVASLREVAVQVAHAVAMQAQSEGLAPEMESEALTVRIKDKVWTPAYAPYLRASASG